MPIPVSGDSGTLACATVSNLTTTRQTIGYSSGAKWLVLSYRLLPGATATAGQYAKVVLNASSDADAAGKLSLPGSYIPIFQGDDLRLDTEAINRIDIIAAQAVGSESTLLRIMAGV